MNSLTDQSHPTSPAHRNDAVQSNQNKPLQGKAAIVTGSTSGIGLAILTALAEAGADVVMNGFGDAAAIEEHCQQLGALYGVDIFYDASDLSKPDDVLRIVTAAERRFGRVDILVNNAGIQHVAPLETFSRAKWDAILALDLSAVFHATQAVLPGMKRRRWGRILNIASAHGLVGSPFKAAYVAAKHGVLGLTKVTALETAEEGITANAICPGYVWTPLVERQIEDQAKAHGIDRVKVVRDILLQQQPNKTFAQAAEIGALATFLCGDLAASITGAALPVDGGWTAH
ncbi:MAG TPA: 3-hydroxybutyrate dehydrogenase [Dongiaceae bacterium]|nr:3-hydroxybutyrate dehydrogenase [Dongiaceae bacterium]